MNMISVKPSIHNILLVILAIMLVGCSNSGKPVPTVKSQKVAILKYATHPALDATENGVIDYLKVASPGLEVSKFNANGNQELAKQLAESITAKNVDVIVAIATPSARAVARTPSTIPIVYGAVADPQGAGILDTGRATGIRNVGPNIIDEALGFMRKAFPKAKNLGVIYNPGEQNSVFVQDVVKQAIGKYGFELVSVEVRDKAQVASAAESLIRRADIIYSANDNTVNAGVSSVVAMANKYSKPFIIGDLSTLEKGPMAAVGLEYYSMGKDVGAMVEQVLSGKSVQNIHPQGAPTPKIWVNKDVIKALNITLPNEAVKAVDAFK